MYRLLIITRKQSTEDMFNAMTQRDLGDFKPPHFRKDYEGALQCMEKHAIDAVAFDDEEPDFYLHMQEKYPALPIFAIGKNAEEQKLLLKELGRLLMRLRADDYNSNYPTAEERMRNERVHWIKRIIGGGPLPLEDLRRQAALYRCPEVVTTPCWSVILSVPEGDDFMLERWHYGKNRLEMALRNFFGTELDKAVVYVVVISPVEIRLVAMPQNSTPQITKANMEKYLSATLGDIGRYLDLKLTPVVVEKKKGLAGLVAEEA